MSRVYAIAGSRSLPPSAAPLVGRVAAAAAASGASLVVGCCVGADAFAVGAALAGSVAPSSLRVLCAFAPGGAGAGGRSAVGAVSAFAARGGSVSWLAGGPLSVPLPARLARRSAAVVGAASAGVLLFLSPAPVGSGSSLVLRCAASRGLPCFVFGGPPALPVASRPASLGGFPCRLVAPPSLF